MESRNVEPDDFESADLDLSEALREAVVEEMEYLESSGRDLRLVRARENDDGTVYQVTVQADDEMYRLSEVSEGNVSRTVFRNPPRDDEMPYEEGDGRDAAAGETEGEDEDDPEDGDGEPEGDEKT